MPSTHAAEVGSRLVLEAMTAADLMSPNPVSISAAATVPEAIALLTERGMSAAPVIEESGRAVGVVSKADILIHEREATRLSRAAGGSGADAARVRDIMTPAVFSVTPETPADSVVEQMITLNVHQLYVVDDDQAVIGAVTVHDILRYLRSEG
jgi:CBS domain-containing protein